MPKRKTKEEFICQAIQVHGNRYDYSQVEYVTIDTKCIVNCKIHSEFLQTPYKHLQGQGCPECANIANGLRFRKTKNTFIEEANKIHNNKFNYSKAIYVGAHRKIEIICKKDGHGTFWQTPRNHLSGNQCPKCSASYKISKVSQEWLQSLNNTNLILEYQLKENKRLFVDAYDPTTNTIFQFHGNYWHGNIFLYNPTDINPHNKKTYGELYQKTIKNENLIKSYGYNLIVMWENEWRHKAPI